MSVRFDAVVVGAGPYGLSVAAHLGGHGLRTAVQGRTLGMWREGVPSGMVLRSHWWATNLSDPRGTHGFARFFEKSGYEPGYPVPLRVFVEYGLWFQQHVVPQVDETAVTRISRQRGEGADYHVTLADGRELVAPVVIMATGLTSYAVRPQEFADLPASLVSHSSEPGDFSRFNRKCVVVVGGGQSAVEYAALLNEAGAHVHLVSRRPLWWLGPDRNRERSWSERLRAPSASIAPGWNNWMLDHAPYAFYRLSRRRRDDWNGTYRSGASHWLRERVLGKVDIHDGHTVTAVQPENDTAIVSMSDGRRVRADHMMLATGFRADLDRLGLFDAQLRSAVRTDSGAPVLSPWFESTAPGLYFVGFSTIRAFGPLYRFVAGAGAAARRVSRAAARRASARSTSTAGSAAQYVVRPERS